MRTSVAMVGWVLLGASALAVGCGGSGAGVSGKAGQMPGLGDNACGRLQPGVGAKALGGERQGSAVALAKLGNRTIAYVADEDDANVHTVDVETGMEIGTTPVSGAPSQILVAPDGRVLVALKDKAALEVLEPAAEVTEPLASRCVVPTAAEPLALTMTPDERSVLVSSGWGAALSAYDLDSLKRKYEIEMPREPRAVVVSDDGKKAFVAHVVGSRMSVVNLETKKVEAIDVGGVEEGSFRGPKLFGGSEIDRRACQGFALAKSTELSGRIFAPEVLVDPGRVDERAEGYGTGGANPPEVAAIAVIDEDTQKPLVESISVKPDLRSMAGVARPLPACLLPRAAAINASTRSLFVACVGIDSVIEYDAGAADPTQAERRRFPVAAGPMAIAVDAVGHRLVVLSQFDRMVHIVPLGEGADKPETSSLDAGMRVALSRKARPAAMADLELGRKLFHTSGDPRISSDGRACASCHPDGRDDALTWATPEGPRQTPMLAGRLTQTAPYGWMGGGHTVEEHLVQTFARLGGSGLARREVDALVAFATSLRPPATEDASGGRLDKALVDRGRQIFHSSDAACGTCHGEQGTFTDHAGHDVKSRAQADIAASFDTPSLRFVGGTAPYFHDGRYMTLRALLVDSDGKMGKTAHLSEADLSALEAYLRTL